MLNITEQILPKQVQDMHNKRVEVGSLEMFHSSISQNRALLAQLAKLSILLYMKTILSNEYLNI